MSKPVPFKYRAFLSYSHRDTKWAEWLHRALETYRIDRDLVGRQTGAGTVPKTLRPIFRDRDDFPAGHSLGEQTLAALEASRFMIVVCSPNSAASKYVNEEIRTFKAMGRAGRMVALIVDGEPGDPARECFPPALRFKLAADGTLTDVREEPIAADARPEGDGKNIAVQKVVAGLLGVGLDEIVHRAERAQRRHARIRNGIIAALLVLSIASAGGFAWAQYELKRNEALLDRTLRRATALVNRAVAMSQDFGMPQRISLGILEEAEDQIRDMSELGRETPQLRYRKALMLLAFARNHAVLGSTDTQRTRAAQAQLLIQGLLIDNQSNRDFRFALAVTHNEIGEVQVAHGDLQTALKSYSSGLGIVERLAGEEPANAEWQRYLATTHMKIGDVQLREAKLQDALQSYRDGLVIAERQVNTGATKLDWRSSMATAHVKIGDIQLHQRDLPAALQSYRESLAIRERLTNIEPNNVGWQFELGISNERVGGVLLERGDFAGALDAFSRRHEIVKRLTMVDPTNAGWQRDLTVSYGKIGEAHLAQGNPPAALQSFREGLAVAERLVKANPGNTGWQRDLQVAYHKIGDVLAKQGDLPAAKQAYRNGLAICEHLAGTDPGNALWQADLVASNAKLALIGDEALRRWTFVVATLRKLKSENKLTAMQASWLPEAERRLAELNNQ